MAREIVLDTETTGIDPRSGHRVIELACIEVEDMLPTGAHLHVYIDPERDIDPAAEKVHGISRQRLRGEPKFADPRAATVTRTAGTGVLLTYQRDSATDPVTGKVVRDAVQRYSFFRAGTRVDLTLTGPSNADNVDPWRIVSDSLTWTS